MPTISIITPVHQPAMTYLPETAESLLAQKLPAGWELQWLIQEDGDSGELEKLLPTDPRIEFAVGRSEGRAPMTRNMALSRATGKYLRGLDADDLLTPGALSRDIEILEMHDEIGWVASSALDLYLDGSTKSFITDPQDGPLRPDEVIESYLAGALSIVGTTMCIRRHLLVALGGWPAMPASEDVGLLLAAEAVAAGWFIAQPSLLYRQHPQQSTALAAFSDPLELAGRRALITERVTALRQLFAAKNIKPEPL